MANETTNNSQGYARQWRIETSDELKYHREKLDAISGQITEIRVEIAKLKVKSGIWGFAAGSIPAAIFIIINADCRLKQKPTESSEYLKSFVDINFS